MNTRVGRFALIVVGVVALLIGGVFAGQGLNLIPGSFMTGDRTWFYVGLVLLAVGVILVVRGLRRPKNERSDS